MKHPKFWMVYSPQGRAPTAQHYTRDDANREAIWLAQSHPGKEFFVLKAVAGMSSKQPKVVRVDLVNADEFQIPF